MPESKKDSPRTKLSEIEPNFGPYKPKCRKSETGCVYQVNDALWEGSFYPRLANGKREKFNAYAKTRETVEKLLAKLIVEKKAKSEKTKREG